MLKASAFIPAMEKHVGDGYVYGTVGQTCTIDLLKKKERQYGAQMGEGYYQLRGDYTKGLCARWLGKWVADCSGLIKAVRRDMGDVFKDVSAQGTYNQCSTNGPISSFPFTPGACLFVWDMAKKRMRHVGMYSGKGYVIESAGVKKGVIRGKYGMGWSHWGLLDWMDYDLKAENAKTPDPNVDQPSGDNTNPKPDDDFDAANPPTLVMGSKGDAVAKMQRILQAKGYGKDFIESGIGEFGSRTLAAVRAFQKANGLVPDGIVGPLTWGAMLKDETPALPPDVKMGSMGVNVLKLQQILNDKGASPQLEVDGIFGPLTKGAAVDFQRTHGLKADGIVGPITWGSLLQ